MKKSLHLWLIIATALILAGGLLFCAVMVTLDWDFRKLSTASFVTSHYQPDAPFQSIRISADTADVELRPSDDGTVSVICLENEKAPHAVSVTDGILAIEQIDDRKWFEKIGIYSRSPKITVLLPREQLTSIDITLSTGDLVLTNVACTADVALRCTTGDTALTNVSCDNLISRARTGELSLTSVTVSSSLTVERDTGDVQISACKTSAINVKTDTGDIKMTDTACTGVTLQTETGDVSLRDCDAAKIGIVTDTGDVTATLLSGKEFLCQSETGRVRHPASSEGGRCEIRSNTGDILVTVS